MEILDTSSKQCKIAIQDGKKYVIRYPRIIGANVEYYRSTPEDIVIKILQEHNVKVPKVLYHGEKYSIQEYIKGQLLSDKYEDHKNIDRAIIDQIIQQICLLPSIDGSELLRYADWGDNRSFYEFQCQNTERVFEGYYKNLRKLYNSIDISSSIFTHLYDKATEISNDRKMSIIHGDRHKKNAILSDNGELTFIDWELGCIGDIAYDIAFHLHQMAYTEDDEKYFLEKLKREYEGDTEKLLSDVELYRLFTLARSTLYHVYWTDLVYQGGSETEIKRQLGHFMRRYNKLCMYEEFKLKPKSEEELEEIFERYRKQEDQER